MVVLYDICADVTETTTTGLGSSPGTGADSSINHHNNDNNNKNDNNNNNDKTEDNDSNHQNMRQQCSQKYLEYASDRAADDGYLFIQVLQATTPPYQGTSSSGSSSSSSSRIHPPTEILIPDKFPDEQRPENKFMYRRDLSSHLGSQIPLRYYTSLEMNTPTVAGRRQRTQVTPLASAC